MFLHSTSQRNVNTLAGGPEGFAGRVAYLARYLCLRKFAADCRPVAATACRSNDRADSGRDSAVSTATGVQVAQTAVGIPAPAKHSSLLQNVQTLSAAHPYSYSAGTGVKRPGREVVHSFPFSAELKNGWSCASTASICLHTVDKDKFTLPFSKPNIGRPPFGCFQ